MWEAQRASGCLPDMRYTSSLMLLAALVACSDQGLVKQTDDPLFPPDTGSVPAVAVTPAHHDFGALVVGATDAARVRIANRGDAPLEVTGLAFEAGSELVLDTLEIDNGPLPWVLDPGRAREVSVLYAPSDTTPDVSELRVASNDPFVPEATADQAGRARPFEDFTNGWYIYDDPTIYQTRDPAWPVNEVGDPDGYWYEPSGLHGLLASGSPVDDFAELAAWVRARAGGPIPVTGPLDLRTTSTVPRLQGASFLYVLCDFWLEPDDDAARYTLLIDDVDDGARVLLDGDVLGGLLYGQGGSWNLAGRASGRLHSVLVIVEDNAAVDKYVLGLRFLRDGIPVGT
jgi:hypothetical protein